MAKSPFLAVFAISSMTLTAQAAAPAETVGALLLRLQEESAAPLVQHCAAKVPDPKHSLDAEYLRFKKKFRQATASLRAGIKTNDELSKPASRELIRQFDEMDAQSLAQFKGSDPRRTCATLKENLSRATVESIQKNMQRAFVQYMAAVRQSK